VKLDKIREIANELVGQLRPYCDRIEIAGSIRRKKPDCGDVEIVCIPRKVSIMGDLFPGHDCKVRDPEFIRTVNSWPAMKGDAQGKYMQRFMRDVQVDIFTADKDNWGLILGIRTGPAEYSHKVLAEGWCAKGYHSKDGYLRKGLTLVRVPEEADLFKLIGLPWVEPNERGPAKSGPRAS